MAALARLDRDRVATYAKTLAELNKERAALEARRTEFSTLRAATQTAQEAAQRAAQAKADLIRDIDSRRDLNAQLSGELQAAQQKLQATLRDLATGATTAEPSVCRWGRSAARSIGRSPAQSPAGSAAARRVPPTASKSPRRKARMSVAVHDGTVAFADTFAGFGNLVIVDHGAQTFSLYGDLLEIDGQERRPDRARPGGRHRRPDPVRPGRALLRASRRRSARSIPYNG